jgi:CBS domain-containing protein
MTPALRIIEQEVALHFRDQLRIARAIAFRDSEAFQEIAFVLERIGAYLLGQMKDLGRYRDAIQSVANKSPMSLDVPSQLPEWHSPFATKYEIVREARNAALHEGALARHLTGNAMELSLVVEEALMQGCYRVGDFMVRNPVCAYLWQPLSFIRQTMLVNSFSYLPVIDEKGERLYGLVSDFQLAQYLRRDGEARARLIQRLREALDSKQMELTTAHMCKPEDRVDAVLSESQGVPMLVVSSDDQLIGILSAFDLL